jgi:hypothetical protein
MCLSPANLFFFRLNDERSLVMKCLSVLVLVLLGPASALSRPIAGSVLDEKHHDCSVAVYDQNNGVPLDQVRVLLSRGEKVIRNESTNPLGIAVLRDVEAGRYLLSVQRLGYSSYLDTVVIDAAHTVTIVRLAEANLPQQEVQVSSSKETNVASSVDGRTGDQVLEGETYHPAPTSGATSLIQENVAGAARAPTGEVHIRSRWECSAG